MSQRMADGSAWAEKDDYLPRNQRSWQGGQHQGQQAPECCLGTAMHRH